MAKSGVLRIKIVGDDGPLNKTLSNAGGKVGRFATSVAKFGAVAGAAAAAGGAAVLNMGAKLEDLDKKAAVVFEDQLPKVRKWAEANAGAMGLTATELTGLTASFADLLKPMGFTAEQAAEMSQETNELSGALAKWSGGQRTAAEVSQILAKAMLGEREGLKELGISITEADVQARLAANGTEELTGAALQQAKAIATQELIMEKSTDAQAAWADGQDDLSVKINKARATVEEFKEKAVRTLLPIVLRITETMARWGQMIATHLAPTIKEITGGFRAFVAAFKAGDGDITSSGFPGFMERLANLARTVVDVVVANWPTIRDTAMAVFAAVGGAITTVQTVVTRVFTAIQEWIDNNRETITGWSVTIVAVFGQIRDVVGSVMAAVTEIIKVAVNIISAFWERFGKHLVDFLVRTVGRIIDVVSGAFQVLKGIFDLIKAVLTGQWGDAWDAIKSILSGAWKVIHTLIAGAWDTIKTLFGAGVAIISQVWSFLWDQVKGVLSDAWDAIVTRVRGGIEAAKSILEEIVGFVGSLPGKIASAARGMWDSIADGFRGMINRVIGWWNSLSFSVPAIDVPGPFNFEGATVGTPNIPMLADGGIVTRPTLAMIGEAGPEAVIPLSRTRSAGPSETHLHFNIGTMIGDKSAIRRMLQEAVRDYERSNGRTALTAS